MVSQCRYLLVWKPCWDCQHLRHAAFWRAGLLLSSSLMRLSLVWPLSVKRYPPGMIRPGEVDELVLFPSAQVVAAGYDFPDREPTCCLILLHVTTEKRGRGPA